MNHCFAYQANGCCTALRINRCDDPGVCPFYKDIRKHTEERERAEARIKEDNYDLWVHYYGNPDQRYRPNRQRGGQNE